LLTRVILEKITVLIKRKVLILFDRSYTGEVDEKLDNLRKDFVKFRRPEEGEKRVLKKLVKLEADLDSFLGPWMAVSRMGQEVYPSQGLLLTPFDQLDMVGLKTLPQDKILETLRLRLFFLELFNHPYRIHFLEQVSTGSFQPPPKIKSDVIDNAIATGFALSIWDLGATTNGTNKERTQRTLRYGEGPFVKLGRQARTFFVGSANPDVWGTSASIATLAATHCLAGIPRNGLFGQVSRQTDLAREVFTQLNSIAEVVLAGREDKQKVLRYWRKNPMGVVEPSPDDALRRAEALYGVGVRAFRIYSPEPGTGPVATTLALRKRFGREVEIVTGQIVDVNQAKRAEAAGADSIYVGIGGGGRCTTGVRSGSAIDWPELVWRLRGEINIPIIVEGGGSDHVATTLLLGASGIGISRIGAGGTVESPGGMLYCVGGDGQMFKPYGGEASARAKYGEGKILPFGIPSFIEGETNRAEINYVMNARPTVAYNLHLLIEDAILTLVFRGVDDLHQLQVIDPSPLRQVSPLGRAQILTH